MSESVDSRAFEDHPLYSKEAPSPYYSSWRARCQQVGASTVAAACFLAPLQTLSFVPNVLPSLPGLSLQPEPICEAPSAASQASIEQLLFDRRNIQEQALEKAKELPTDQRKAFVRQTVAQALQLHVNDTSSLTSSLKHAESFTDQKTSLMSYFSKFGITEVGPAKPQDLVQNWKPITQESYHDEQITTMLTLVETLRELPEEYVKTTGITRIVFAENTAVTDSRVHLAYVVKDAKGIASQTMVININQKINTDTFHHEFYHKIDEKSCGNGQKAGNDPSFTSLTTIPKNVPRITLEDYAKKVQEVNEAIEWTAPDCIEQVARANAVLGPLAEATVLATPYAAQNTLEQKAELFSGTNRISPRLPKLRRQLVLLLARLNDFNPNLAKYLALSQASERLVYTDLQTKSDEPDARRCG